MAIEHDRKYIPIHTSISLLDDTFRPPKTFSLDREDDTIITIYCLCEEVLEAIGHRDDPQVRLFTTEVTTVPLVSAAFFYGNIDKTRLFLHEYGYMKEMISKSETSLVTTQRLGGARVGRKLGC